MLVQSKVFWNLHFYFLHCSLLQMRQIAGSWSVLSIRGPDVWVVLNVFWNAHLTSNWRYWFLQSCALRTHCILYLFGIKFQWWDHGCLFFDSNTPRLLGSESRCQYVVMTSVRIRDFERWKPSQGWNCNVVILPIEILLPDLAENSKCP